MRQLCNASPSHDTVRGEYPFTAVLLFYNQASHAYTFEMASSNKALNSKAKTYRIWFLPSFYPFNIYNTETDRNRSYLHKTLVNTGNRNCYQHYN